MLKINIDNTLNFISKEEINTLKSEVALCNKSLYDRSGKGSDFLGWLDLPSKISSGELKKINECAKKLSENSDIILVIGIGGSYLGARAVIDALSNNFNQLLSKSERNAPLVLCAGNNIGEDYHAELPTPAYGLNP